MQPNWVDFKVVKEQVTMRMALDHYGIKLLQKKGSELHGRCPIHKGKSEDSFNVNLDKNCFQCFAGSCGKRGNVLDFVAGMEKCSVRDAALKLAGWFSIGGSAAESESCSEQQTNSQLARKKEAVGERGEPNKPLKFGALKNVDYLHPYLTERGVSRETAELFGAGFFSGRGLMSGRIVIPIHNERGELVAYAGRAIDGSEPRYKLPEGFHKSLELFNLHRTGEADTVIVVEGFFDCMKVHQAGYPCVALMGCSLSETQEDLLRGFGGAVLLLDGDEAGRRATDECLLRLGRCMWVKAVVVPSGKQPDQLSDDELHDLLKK